MRAFSYRDGLMVAESVPIPAIAAAVERSFATGGPEALVVKILNADLPIDEEPDVGLAD